MSGLDAQTVSRQLLVVLDEALLGASEPTTYFVANRSGSGFLGTLARVDAATAWSAIGDRTIAAHANHVAFAMEASAAWIEGDRAPRDWMESWQVVDVDAEAWGLLKARVGQQYRALRGRSSREPDTTKRRSSKPSAQSLTSPTILGPCCRNSPW